MRRLKIIDEKINEINRSALYVCRNASFGTQ